MEQSLETCESEIKNSPLYLPEILLMVFSHLNVSDICAAAQVCKLWREASMYKFLWKNVTVEMTFKKHYSDDMYMSLKQRGVKRIKALSVKPKRINKLLRRLPDIMSFSMNYCILKSEKYIFHMFATPLPNITELDLSLCYNLTDSCIKWISVMMKELNRLSIRGNLKITNNSLFFMAYHLKKLKYVSISRCGSISDLGLWWLTGQCKYSNSGNDELEFLNLDHCSKITDVSLRFISEGLRNIRVLSLSNCKELTDIGFSYFASMKYLKDLDLSFTNITDDGVKYLSRLHSLDDLNLYCTQITELSIRHLFEGCLKLVSLDVTMCENFNYDYATMKKVCMIENYNTKSIRLNKKKNQYY